MRDIASFLRSMRLRAGLTQVEAADGIMQKDSLSLIERGRRFPHPEHFLLLVERYGLTGYSLGDFFDQKTARLLELKNRILAAMRLMELGLLPELLFCFRTECLKPDDNGFKTKPFSMQFYEYALSWYIHANGGTADDYLNACVKCLRMTQPHFDDSFHVASAFLIQNEIMILNSIACLLAHFSRKRKALILFEELLIKHRHMISSHPIYFNNLACLMHNAALLEWRLHPSSAEKHLTRALSLCTQYGGAWQACRIWRSQLQVRRQLYPQKTLTDELWSLRSMYEKFRPVCYLHYAFEEFMGKSEWIELF